MASLRSINCAIFVLMVFIGASFCQDVDDNEELSNNREVGKFEQDRWRAVDNFQNGDLGWIPREEIQDPDQMKRRRRRLRKRKRRPTLDDNSDEEIQFRRRRIRPYRLESWQDMNEEHLKPLVRKRIPITYFAPEDLDVDQTGTKNENYPIMQMKPLEPAIIIEQESTATQNSLADLKKLLKEAEDKLGLSEILQQKNLSLSDLLGGTEKPTSTVIDKQTVSTFESTTDLTTKYKRLPPSVALKRDKNYQQDDDILEVLTERETMEAQRKRLSILQPKENKMYANIMKFDVIAEPTTERRIFIPVSSKYPDEDTSKSNDIKVETTTERKTTTTSKILTITAKDEQEKTFVASTTPKLAGLRSKLPTTNAKLRTTGKKLPDTNPLRINITELVGFPHDTMEVLTTRKLYTTEGPMRISIDLEHMFDGIDIQPYLDEYDTQTNDSEPQNETYVTAKQEIMEVINDPAGRENLSRILEHRNMTLEELVEQRERGSSQKHLADIFHNNTKEPEPKDEPHVGHISSDTFDEHLTTNVNQKSPNFKDHLTTNVRQKSPNFEDHLTANEPQKSPIFKDNFTENRQQKSSNFDDHLTANVRQKSPNFDDHLTTNVRKQSPNFKDHLTANEPTFVDNFTENMQQKSSNFDDHLTANVRQKSPNFEDHLSVNIGQKNPNFDDHLTTNVRKQSPNFKDHLTANEPTFVDNFTENMQQKSSNFDDHLTANVRQKSPNFEDHLSVNIGQKNPNFDDHLTTNVRQQSLTFKDHLTANEPQKSPIFEDNFTENRQQKSSNFDDHLTANVRQKSPNFEDHLSVNVRQKSPNFDDHLTANVIQKSPTFDGYLTANVRQKSPDLDKHFTENRQQKISNFDDLVKPVGPTVSSIPVSSTLATKLKDAYPTVGVKLDDRGLETFPWKQLYPDLFPEPKETEKANDAENFNKIVQRTDIEKSYTINTKDEGFFDGIPSGVKSALLVSFAIIAMSLLIFLGILVILKWTSKKNRSLNYCSNLTTKFRPPMLQRRQTAAIKTFVNETLGRQKNYYKTSLQSMSDEIWEGTKDRKETF